MSEPKSPIDRPIVLVVSDDDRMCREGTAELGTHGIDARAAGMAEAHQRVGDARPDLLIVDLDGRNPGGVGLSGLTASVPTIVLSSDDAAEAVVDLLHTGAAHVVRKPCAWPVLAVQALRVLHPWRELRRVQRENQALRCATPDFDPLTGVPSLPSFRRRVEQAIARARRRDHMVAVALLDLERFGRINELHGHDVGDATLCQVAQRLEAAVRESDAIGRVTPAPADDLIHVSRVGGDKFVVLLEELTNPGQAAVVVKRIHKALGEPLPVGAASVSLSARAGISLYPIDGLDSTDLLKNAEAAIHRAAPVDAMKRIRFFSRTVADRQRRELDLEESIQEAIDTGAFELAYQPKVRLSNGEPAGFEALLRYRHPKLGPVPAPQVIGVAERTGLIHALGREIFLRVCLDATRAHRETGSRVRLMTNFSPCQLASAEWGTCVERVLVETKVDPQLVGIEITESTLVDDRAELVTELQGFADRGIEISLDDFGTGYSHLGYLTRIPLHEIKIDRSFVAEMSGENPTSREIAGLVVILGRTLGMRVVGEGAETEEQVEMLRTLGCHAIQGYYFARPGPLETFFDAIRAGRIEPADSPATPGP